MQWIEILPTFLGHPNAAQFCLNLFRSSLWPYVKRIISVEYVKGNFLENTNTWKKNPNSVFYSILQISTLENELLTKPYYCMTYYGIINCSWPVPSIKNYGFRAGTKMQFKFTNSLTYLSASNYLRFCRTQFVGFWALKYLAYETNTHLYRYLYASFSFYTNHTVKIIMLKWQYE